MKDYDCFSCPHCEPTNNYMTGYCVYWGKIVSKTDGCSLDDEDDEDDFDDFILYDILDDDF